MKFADSSEKMVDEERIYYIEVVVKKAEKFQYFSEVLTMIQRERERERENTILEFGCVEN